LETDCHAKILVEAGEFLDLEVAIVTVYTLVKDVERKVLHHLRENEFAAVHNSASRTLLCEDNCPAEKISSL
jgi:hypothetical protein